MDQDLLSQIRKGKTLSSTKTEEKTDTNTSWRFKGNVKNENLDFASQLKSRLQKKNPLVKRQTPKTVSQNHSKLKPIEKREVEDLPPPPPPPPSINDSVDQTESNYSVTSEDSDLSLQTSSTKDRSEKHTVKGNDENSDIYLQLGFGDDTLQNLFVMLNLKCCHNIKDPFRSTNNHNIEEVLNVFKAMTREKSSDIVINSLQLNVFVILNALKLYFKQTFPPHFPYKCYPSIVKIGKEEKFSDLKKKAKLVSVCKKIMKKYPRKCMEISKLLAFLSQFEDVDSGMLSHVWSPSLLNPRFEKDNLMEVMTEKKAINKSFQLMIVYHEEIFPQDLLEKYVFQHNQKIITHKKWNVIPYSAKSKKEKGSPHIKFI